MNNKQKLNKTAMKKKIYWTEQHILELRKLSNKYLSDSRIANSLSSKFNDRFTANSVKRKRQRLNLAKYKEKIISEDSFYARLKKKQSSEGFNPLFFPSKLINKFNIKNGDFLLLSINNKEFTTKIKEIKRKDRKKNNFVFYAPFELLGEDRTGIVKFINKISNVESKSVVRKGSINMANLLADNDKLIITINSNKEVIVNKKRSSVPFKLQKKIKITKELMQSLGFFQGEGTKKHPRRLEITNSDSNLVKLFINTSNKLFNIQDNEWKIRLKYNSKSKDSKLENKFIKHWSSKLNVSPNNFLKSEYMEGNPDVDYGSVQVYVPRLVLREIWMELLSLSYNLIKDNQDYARWFLQGVLAADGCPMFSNGKLIAVQIRIENKEEGQIYMNALSKLGIKASFYPKTREIRIGRISEIKKVYDYGLFTLHKKRHYKFIRGINKKLKND